MIYRLLLAFCTFAIFSCHSKKTEVKEPEKAPKQSGQFIPVTDMIAAELDEIDTLPLGPLKIISVNGKDDSTWVKREKVRAFAQPFLTPHIDSASLGKLFSEKSFLDQTINAITFSYDPIATLPDSLQLRRWDVYINPQTQEMERVYLLKERSNKDTTHTIQLTWKAKHWCQITYIDEHPGSQPRIRKEKMIWNFND